MITSISNKKVKQIIQWQSKARERRESKVFIAEGIKMFEEAPTDLVMEVYLSEGLADRLYGADGPRNADRQSDQTLLQQKLAQTGYELVSDEVFRRMSDTQTPQGILSVMRQPQHHLEELLKKPQPLFIVLENLQDPGNLGTIMRTAEGAGVTGVILSADTVDIFNPKTIRSTMGSIYRVPFFYTDDLQNTIRQLQDAGVATYAAHLQGKEYYGSFSFREPTAFLIGNEGNGLKEETARLAGHYLKIPMEGKLESLNASVASALLMYEAHRQRHSF